MTKSELIEAIAAKQTQLSLKDVELAVKSVIEQMSNALTASERIEIRGFGSFLCIIASPVRDATLKRVMQCNFPVSLYPILSRAKSCESGSIKVLSSRDTRRVK